MTRIKSIVAHHPFWDKVDKNGPTLRDELGPCWLWTGGSDPDGYGRFDTPTGKRGAHQVGYELQNGPIPEGHLIMHRCDNPPCVRGEHLTTGTNADNLKDMAEKGRARGGRRRKDGSEPKNRLA